MATNTTTTKKENRIINATPLLQRLTKQEASCITNAFRLYDAHSTGKIPYHLAKKLIHSFGITTVNDENLMNFLNVSSSSSSSSSIEISLYDLLTAMDKLIPEPEPILLSSLESFTSFAANKEIIDPNQPDAMIRVIDPQSIAKFMESLGRPPINMNEATLMLNSMLEYDDCSEVPLVNIDIFNKELVNFAKKTNAFKEYRG